MQIILSLFKYLVLRTELNSKNKLILGEPKQIVHLSGVGNPFSYVLKIFS